MPSRRFHQKTRLGCIQCKKRRMKCDETRPACEQCVKRGSECTFEHPFLEYTVPAEPSWQKALPTTLHDTPGPTGFHNALPALGHLGPALQTAEAQRQELMHHFVNHTAVTLSNKEEITQLWKDDVPKLARQHSCVLDALLGMTALHRAHVNSSDAAKHIEIAMRYQADAISSFKTQFCELRPENADVFMVYSSITLLFAIACRVLKPGYWPGDCLQATMGIFALLRDTARVVRMEYDWFTQGAFAPFSRLDEPDRSAISPEARTCVQELRGLSCVATSDGESVREIYADTIWCLERSWMRASSHSFNSVFPVSVQEGYITLLREHDPVALVILTHWAAFLHDFRRYWYIGNWGRELVATVSGSLSSEWLPHIQRVVRVVSSGD